MDHREVEFCFLFTSNLASPLPDEADLRAGAFESAELPRSSSGRRGSNGFSALRWSKSRHAARVGLRDRLARFQPANGERFEKSRSIKGPCLAIIFAETSFLAEPRARYWKFKMTIIVACHVHVGLKGRICPADIDHQHEKKDERKGAQKTHPHFGTSL
jgi:hypothetical protein